ncbi:MAG: ABC-2 transporter permease [Clostridia bacterium]|nr:ABC-2 transporter permease [Clostridia bacterium]
MKSALLQEFLMWKNTRKRFIVVAVVIAAVCALSEYIFIFGAFLVFGMGFASCAESFEEKHKPISEAYRKGMPTTVQQSIAARYMVLLCEALVYCLAYIAACAFTDLSRLDIFYDETDYSLSMVKRGFFSICFYFIVFGLVFPLYYKIKRGKGIILGLMMVVVFTAFSFAHIEFNSVLRHDKWVLLALVLSVPLVLWIGYASAVWAEAGQSCGKKIKTSAIVCAVIVPVICVTLNVLDEYNFFGENAPLGFIYYGINNDNDEIYPVIDDYIPTEETRANSEAMLDVMGEVCLDSNIGMSFSECIEKLRDAGFEGESYGSMAQLFKGDVSCMLSDQSTIYSDIIMDGNSMQDNVKKVVTCLALSAYTGGVYYENGNETDIAALASAFESCESEAELHQAFKDNKAVPQQINEISLDSGKTGSRNYILTGCFGNYENSGNAKEFTITVITVEQKITSVKYVVE